MRCIYFIAVLLQPLDLRIRNWTAYHGYLGDTMTIKHVSMDHISVDAPKAKNTQVVLREDFELVWDVWRDYKAQRVKRYELRDMTYYSKYIKSILQWYEREKSSN